MKRRKFIQALGMVPAGLVASRFLPEIKPNNDFELFWDKCFDDICNDQEIPREIIEMEFNKGYSLSREIGRLEKAKLYNIEYT